MKIKTILMAAGFVLVLGLAAAGLLREAPADSAGSEGRAAQGPGASRARENSFSYTTLSDDQGAVTVEVTPLGLDAGGETLVFEVAMNTHSVDLSMDLAELATLSTDTGVTVEAQLWDAMLGGHHISGQLSFPAQSNGEDVLAGATRITITILGVDAEARTFTWDR